MIGCEKKVKINDPTYVGPVYPRKKGANLASCARAMSPMMMRKSGTNTAHSERETSFSTLDTELQLAKLAVTCKRIQS
jgi:hypothetical protein